MEDVKLSNLEYEELLTLNEKVKDAINFLENEIKENTEEV